MLTRRVGRCVFKVLPAVPGPTSRELTLLLRSRLWKTLEKSQTGWPAAQRVTTVPLVVIQGDLNQSPMQWNSEPLGGFTNGTDTYRALNPDYQTVNVKAQQDDKQSHLKIFKHLLSLRSQPAISLGIQEYPVVNEDIFSLLRVQKGSPGYLLVLNMGANTTTTDFVGKSDYLPENGRVEVRSLNIKDGPLADGDHPKVGLNDIVLEPTQAVVFSFVPVFKD